MKNHFLLGVSLFCGALAVPSRTAAQELVDCAGLLSLTDASLSVVTSEVIEATSRLPAHCRVHGFILPNVNFELKLPADWNGKFFMVGNGGYLGTFFDQSYGLVRGYATASTDTGHQGPDPRFALDNRAAEIDFAFRSIHVTAVAAKRLIAAHYGRAADFAYFRGCSTGGRQGLMEAQRFPDDFDGWSIGAPIYDYTRKQTYNASWVAKALFDNNREGYVPRPKLKALGAAVYAQCDAVDGLEDGIIDDPRQCDFEPREDLVQCPAGTDHDQCFTPAQIDAIRRIYDGPGATVYPGAIVGGEWRDVPENEMGGGWDVYFTGMMKPAKNARNSVGQMDRDPYGGSEFQPVQLRNASSFWKYLAFETDRPDFNLFEDLDFSAVPDTSFMAGLMNADNPDLSPVHDGGKKIILWHGWADVGLNPLATLHYYEAVRATAGGAAADSFMRLFMVPGMYHCEGGPGPDVFDDLTALEKWVEDGVPPANMLAYKTEGQNDFYPHRAPRSEAHQARIKRSRPLCPYPEVARHTGVGSIDNAANFACRLPAQ